LCNGNKPGTCFSKILMDPDVYKGISLGQQIIKKNGH
jgi:hypothetical protein